MRQIKLTSKLVLALVATVVVFSAMTVPSVVAQSTSSPPIRANSVTSGSIKDGEVKTDDLANDAVTSAKIADGTIQLIIRQFTEIESFAPGVTGRITVDCPSGQFLTGGGFLVGPSMRVEGSQPIDVDSWAVNAENQGTADDGVIAYALCIDPTIP